MTYYYNDVMVQNHLDNRNMLLNKTEKGHDLIL